MGAAASIDNQGLNNVDYQTLRAAGINFASAHSALESKIQKGKSAQALNDVSLLAIRQLSQNLRNQDDLEKTRKKVLKSRSLPDNLNYHQQYYDYKTEDEYFAVKDEFDQTDLDLIDDAEFVVSSDQVRDENDAQQQKQQQQLEQQQEKKKGKKPGLMLMVSETGSFSGGANDASITNNNAPFAKLDKEEERSRPLSPNSQARISPHGTLYMGKLKIKETGIFPDDSPYTANRKVMSAEFISFEDSFSWEVENETNEGPENVLPALGGKKDFIEIATLGSGASGVVAEAMHVPSLTIVALKMLPVYNQEKRQSVSRELAVLHKNLTEMRLIDDKLNPNGNNVDDSNSDKSSRCENVLSLYNAFIDPKSGMINLVVEYMDGGSLEDLVKQGGCNDERVLADISFQTLNGLSYLHRNKSIHRDIKPANILCSSSGVIKIADFGISKALDKSTGFANSFVGTVCYMSPERITGDSYSFSCDIWSLGLTILAVAKGRFPIYLKQDDDDEDIPANSDAHGKGPTVIGGPQGYWAMMKAICDDQPPAAGKRFSKEFNNFIDKFLQKDPQNRYSAQELMEHVFVTSKIVKFASHHHGYDTSEPSLLTNHLAAVTIAKTTSRDIAAEDMKQERGINVGMDTIDEEIGQEERDIIYSIRMEHLDRLLEKLHKIMVEQKYTNSNKFINTPTRPEDLKWASSPSIMSTMQSKPFDFGSLNSSMESIDNLVIKGSPEQAKEGRVSFEKDPNNRNKFGESNHHSILKSGNTTKKDSDGERTKVHNGPSINNSSSRSVHFQDNDDIAAEKSFKKSFKKKNLAPLNLGIINDEDMEEDADFLLDLPKTSSYFATTNNQEAPFKLKEKRSVPKIAHVEYGRMLPKLNKRGLAKWQNLARQLHLPLGIVLVAVRDKLGKLVDLDAED